MPYDAVRGVYESRPELLWTVVALLSGPHPRHGRGPRRLGLPRRHRPHRQAPPRDGRRRRRVHPADHAGGARRAWSARRASGSTRPSPSSSGSAGSSSPSAATGSPTAAAAPRSRARRSAASMPRCCAGRRARRSRSLGAAVGAVRPDERPCARGRPGHHGTPTAVRRPRRPARRADTGGPSAALRGVPWPGDVVGRATRLAAMPSMDDDRWLADAVADREPARRSPATSASSGSAWAGWSR